MVAMQAVSRLTMLDADAHNMRGYHSLDRLDLDGSNSGGREAMQCNAV